MRAAQIVGLGAPPEIVEPLVYLFGGGHGIARDGFLAERVAIADGVAHELAAGLEPAVAAAGGDDAGRRQGGRRRPRPGLG